MYDRAIKRCIDVIFSGVALLVLAPVYLVLMVLVRVDMERSFGCINSAV